jgi:hypothetical protein
VRTHSEYGTVAQEFAETSKRNYAAIRGENPEEGDPFQQFFFRVADDTGLAVTDYFIDFHVLKEDNSLDPDLTKLFDHTFKADVHTHSIDASCRVMMINCGQLTSFGKQIIAAKGKLVFDITAALRSEMSTLFKDTA